MNTKVIGAIGAVLVLGAIGVVAANMLAGPTAGGTPITTTDQVIKNPRPSVQAQGNTFGIMTPEEKAAKEAEEARLAAEAASSTATSTEAGEDGGSEAEDDAESES